MKTISILALAFSLSFSAHAKGKGKNDHIAPTADDIKFVAKNAQVPSSCAKKFLTKAAKECDANSWKQEKEDREHPCLFSDVLSDVKKGTIKLGFTVGDADEWYYKVSLTDVADADQCDFTISAQEE